MVNHELTCYSTPKNKRACSGCIHLEEIETSYYRENRYNYSETEYKTKAFRCKKLDKILYPYKVEKLKLLEKYPESFEDQEPMPNRVRTSPIFLNSKHPIAMVKKQTVYIPCYMKDCDIVANHPEGAMPLKEVKDVLVLT